MRAQAPAPKACRTRRRAERTRNVACVGGAPSLRKKTPQARPSFQYVALAGARLLAVLLIVLQQQVLDAAPADGARKESPGVRGPWCGPGTRQGWLGSDSAMQ